MVEKSQARAGTAPLIVSLSTSSIILSKKLSQFFSKSIDYSADYAN